jgi:hypothetical protein
MALSNLPSERQWTLLRTLKHAHNGMLSYGDAVSLCGRPTVDACERRKWVGIDRMTAIDRLYIRGEGHEAMLRFAQREADRRSDVGLPMPVPIY